MEQAKRTALLVMDMEAGILSRYHEAKTLVAVVRKAIHAARSKDIPVIYVVVGFRKGAPEVSAANKFFGGRKEQFANANMDEFTTIHSDIAPADGEPAVVKRRVSAFAGSDLDVLLRSMNITDLVLTGVATSGVVLSTLVEASDKDFGLTVLRDGCGDADSELHRVLMDNFFPKRAEVLSVEDWITKQ